MSIIFQVVSARTTKKKQRDCFVWFRGFQVPRIVPFSQGPVLCSDGRFSCDSSSFSSLFVVFVNFVSFLLFAEIRLLLLFWHRFHAHIPSISLVLSPVGIYGRSKRGKLGD